MQIIPANNQNSPPRDVYRSLFFVVPAFAAASGQSGPNPSLPGEKARAGRLPSISVPRALAEKSRPSRWSSVQRWSKAWNAVSPQTLATHVRAKENRVRARSEKRKDFFFTGTFSAVKLARLTGLDIAPSLVRD